jgi:hypothetical protein
MRNSFRRFCLRALATAKDTEPWLRRPYAGERAWMALIEKPEDTESDDQKAGAEPDRTPSFDQADEQRKGRIAADTSAAASTAKAEGVIRHPGGSCHKPPIVNRLRRHLCRRVESISLFDSGRLAERCSDLEA